MRTIKRRIYLAAVERLRVSLQVASLGNKIGDGLARNIPTRASDSNGPRVHREVMFFQTMPSCVSPPTANSTETLKTAMEIALARRTPYSSTDAPRPDIR